MTRSFETIVTVCTLPMVILSAALEAVGYGSERPLAANGSEDGKAKKRRVELVKINPQRT